MHAELGQPIDLVAPQIDTHGSVCRGPVDVDDGTAHGHFPAMLDLILASVSQADELRHQLLRINPITRLDHHRRRLLDMRPETLEQRLHRSDDHRRRVGSTTGEMPHRLQAATHRLHIGAHPLKRQGLPRREDIDGRLAQVGTEISGNSVGIVRCRRDHHQRLATAQLGDARKDESPPWIGHPDRRRTRPEEVDEVVVGAKKRGQRGQRHGASTLPTPAR